ncbi:hypothetical protein [Arthrobacter sp. ISL-48]|nr:hypothetical protein [Arthrobacter sp. ISL-48]
MESSISVGSGTAFADVRDRLLPTGAQAPGVTMATDARAEKIDE